MSMCLVERAKDNRRYGGVWEVSGGWAKKKVYLPDSRFPIPDSRFPIPYSLAIVL
ncbi:hypothetical protein [Moorena sp. SIO3H5]|uniref:hypothetical protein n=1 Tax=Moorena sp. SIO3H5 TaxID=2607834 RepID=UPI0013B6D953|nr:hypothetical protein [Moorena sp. SIO3H5]NEO71223.1 hypothetical protein [Moorena sp. SIO3H5]